LVVQVEVVPPVSQQHLDALHLAAEREQLLVQFQVAAVAQLY
jgi:hypothetical protein